MSDKNWIVLLLLLWLIYKLVRWQEAQGIEQNYHPPTPPHPPKKEAPSSRKLNRVEDDPIIVPPDISHRPPRIQTLIRLMWSDLKNMIKFKNEVDHRNTERWYKKEHLFEALKFTNYQEFNGFYHRWKKGFDAWPEWKEYLKEWKSLGEY